MTVFVVVPMEEGLIGEVKVFLSRDGAHRAERQWLCRGGIRNDKDRERLSDLGTGIAIVECEIRP
jgi:hypothetical protein